MNVADQYLEGFAENNGVKIFYRDYGPVNGDPILMVHGLGAQLVHWPPHLIHFLQLHNFRPITYDNRDVGLSSRFSGTPSFMLDYIKYFLRLPIKSEYNIDDMADDGIKLLETLHIEQAHVLGTSMGGMIAQIISAQYPQKVKSFTLIASTASTPSPINAPSKPVRDLMMERSKNPNASVEEVIEDHYENQLKKLGNDEMELKAKIEKFKSDEINHKNIAYESGANNNGIYAAMDKIIKTGSRIAISISEKI